ncbi:ATP-binding protein [Roseateles cellulosilyticus]|uniref:ATP-binding protein n=1 Tax=Pelomonas cellulosilytica TaxID=2906762 RepID=A0ABS8XUE0_9BURK|nr:ATP-binding protein [Pelomonas sp. P8]MCE4554241.1 ATP-binding protein [Pelomonas sp. P8]
MSVQLAVEPPWASWFVGLETDADLLARVTQRPAQLVGLHGKSATIACDELRKAWKQVYLPGAQHLSVLRKLVDRAKRNAMERLPCMRAYEEAVYARTPVTLQEQEIWGLTGLAGVGKTSLQRALARALKPPEGFCLAPSVQVPSSPIVHLTMTAQRSSQPILRQLASPVFVANRTNISPDDLVRHLRERLFAQGALLMPVDELQSMTRSESATTLIANLLVELNELGPYVIYCFNYSLGHKLLLRPQEDKDRLLANLLHLDAPRREDPCWRDVVAEYVGVAPDLFDIAPERDSDELHQLTGGLYRLLGFLLLEACRTAWPTAVQRRVSMADVRRAFQSGAYCSQRIDIETLQSIGVNSRDRDRRRDLACPFPDLARSAGGAAAVVSPSVARRPTPAAEYAMESALTVDERRVLVELREGADQASSTGRKPATVTKLPARQSLTAQALLAGEMLITQPKRKGAKEPGRADGSTEEPP